MVELKVSLEAKIRVLQYMGKDPIMLNVHIDQHVYEPDEIKHLVIEAYTNMVQGGHNPEETYEDQAVDMLAYDSDIAEIIVDGEDSYQDVVNVIADLIKEHAEDGKTK